jgi:murein DD-endopeptidase MepM/ murein hydrolase activator NlpD
MWERSSMKRTTVSRRMLVMGALGLGWAGSMTARAVQGQPARTSWQWSYPIAWPGEVIADGFVNLHGYAVENIPWYPGLWHTGENWHADQGETAGALVLAAADGEVIYAGSDYPGLVVIIRHAGDRVSMYGHLAYEAAVVVGDRVRRGDLIGTVLQRTDGRLSHLHFELRTFLMTPEVNGAAPRHQFNCGPECPPGPGYWPMDDPDHPSVMGWRNPTSLINQQAFGGDPVPDDAEIVVSRAAGERASVWSQPKHRNGAEQIDELVTTPGDRHHLLEIDPGDPAGTATSAEGYRLWYRIDVPGSGNGWVQAAIPSKRETGSDGRPATVRYRFLPNVVEGR